MKLEDAAKELKESDDFIVNEDGEVLFLKDCIPLVVDSSANFLMTVGEDKKYAIEFKV